MKAAESGTRWIYANGAEGRSLKLRAVPHDGGFVLQGETMGHHIASSGDWVVLRDYGNDLRDCVLLLKSAGILNHKWAWFKSGGPLGLPSDYLCVINDNELNINGSSKWATIAHDGFPWNS
jgi:hypothetical protein